MYIASGGGTGIQVYNIHTDAVLYVLYVERSVKQCKLFKNEVIARVENRTTRAVFHMIHFFNHHLYFRLICYKSKYVLTNVVKIFVFTSLFNIICEGGF